MAESLKFVLWKYKETSNAEKPIYLRITVNRNVRYVSTGIAIQAKHWNESSGQVRRKHPAYQIYNNELTRLMLEAVALQFELKGLQMLTADEMKRRLQNKSKDFFQYAQLYIEGLKNNGKIRRAKQTQVIVNKMQHFTQRNSLPLNEIDLNYLQGLETHLITHYHNSVNTIQKDFQRLRSMLKLAVTEGLIPKNPFDQYGPLKWQKAQKAALTFDQIQTMIALNLPVNSVLWHTRNFFLFSFYNAGIRFKDICLLQWQHIVDGRLIYQMSKNKKHKNIYLLPEAVAILEHYKHPENVPETFIFPLLDNETDYSDPALLDAKVGSKNAIVNKNLKKIAALADIQTNVSFHISRHSFAEFARKRGMSVYDISKALAHSDLKTTEEYLKSFDEESLDSSMKEIFTQSEQSQDERATD